MVIRAHVLALMFLCTPLLNWGQTGDIDSLNNLRTKLLIVDADSIKIDEMSIVPDSFEIRNEDELPEDAKYNVDYARSLLLTENMLGAELDLLYRVFPFNFSKKQSSVKVQEEKIDSIKLIYFPDTEVERKVFEFDKLKVDGGVGRSFSFGNSQDLVLNSNLNLRISGTLDNGVEIAGALTDDNVPFQPEGNSRQIRELDKVFLQFSKDNHRLQLGDYEQRSPNSYFLKYNKRLQGISYTGIFEHKNDWQTDAFISGAASRGKFSRNEIKGIEGNQGPYKLFGSNRESYIIILAGTERVFIDGALMERGQDRDYIIDYNIGELIFTSRRLINNQSRIVIEFEYTDRTYSRTFLHSEANYGNEKLNFRVNVYTEQDSKRNANVGDTTINTRSAFKDIGDNINDFFIPSFRPEPYTEERIQYELVRDSVVNGITYDSIFVFSNNPALQLYRVIFTFVGEGNGDYDVESQVLNGRVFKWQPPIGDQRQGSYVAAIRLVPPQKKQMLTLASSYALNDENVVSLEAAVSNNDLNTLSSIGNDDNVGQAIRLKWNGKHYLGRDSLHGVLSSNFNYEFKQKKFNPIERYRNVEFSRDWNLDQNILDTLNENIGVLRLDYNFNPYSSVNYRLSSFFRENGYTGFNNNVGYKLRKNGLDVRINFNALNTKQDTLKSFFIRPDFDISNRFGILNGIRIGARGQRNHREFQSELTDQLILNSFKDDTYALYFETSDTSKLRLKVSAGQRQDHFKNLLGNALGLAQTSNFIEAQGELKNIKDQQLSWNVTWRKLNIDNNKLTTEKAKNSLLGRLDYATNIWKGLIRTGMSYEIGSGREPRREFSYIEVNKGEGNFIWNDYNDNGLQEINEFETAIFQDEANYIRIFTTTNEYINADVTRLNQFVHLQPATAWRNSQGITRFLSKFSLNSNLSISRKIFEDADVSIFNPFVFNVDNSSLVSSNIRLTNMLTFNKLSNKFRMGYSYKVNENKNQLLAGFEKRERLEHGLTTDIYLKNKLTLQNTLGYLTQSFGAENYTQKNFDFGSFSFSPRLSWVLSNSLRLALTYDLTNSENDIVFGGEKATTNALKFDFNYNKINNIALLGSLSFDKVDYNGDTNSAVTYSMLNGLQAGNNLVWRINMEREVLKSVKINLAYDGRKLGDNNPVHTGKARISAVF